MSNPYIETVYDVLNEALDEVEDARRHHYMVGGNDFSIFEIEKQVILRIKDNLRLKLEEMENQNGV
jgi:hypothetical protein